jgi:hypothetical protein
MERYCHGFVSHQRCRFTWRDQDDWKYFLVDGVKLDVMEYDAVMARIRSTPAIGIGIGPLDLPPDHQRQER